MNILRELKDKFNENAPNNDFDLRNGQSWLLRENNFIKKCFKKIKIDKTFITKWVEMKDLYGRTAIAFSHRLSVLQKKDFKIEIEIEKVIMETLDTPSRKCKSWSKDEDEKLIKQY